jgi:hypothetical protein
MLSALVIPILVLAGFVVKDNSRTKTLTISFYETPLVCTAAPEIGCGSRSKPALLKLEKNPAVKEAWLNRQGTVIAIVWVDKPQTEKVAKPIFENNNISFEEVPQSDADTYKQTFRKANLWYRGAAVDQLSLEEASVIAKSTIKPALESKLISFIEAENIRRDVETYFKKELVKVRTNEQLNNDSENKWRVAMVSIAEKYIGKDRTEQAMKLYMDNCEQQCKKQESCTQPGTKKTCCSKD